MAAFLQRNSKSWLPTLLHFATPPRQSTTLRHLSGSYGRETLLSSILPDTLGPPWLSLEESLRVGLTSKHVLFINPGKEKVGIALLDVCKKESYLMKYFEISDEKKRQVFQNAVVKVVQDLEVPLCGVGYHSIRSVPNDNNSLDLANGVYAILKDDKCLMYMQWCLVDEYGTSQEAKDLIAAIGVTPFNPSKAKKWNAMACVDMTSAALQGKNYMRMLYGYFLLMLHSHSLGDKKNGNMTVHSSEEVKILGHLECDKFVKKFS